VISHKATRHIISLLTLVGLLIMAAGSTDNGGGKSGTSSSSSSSKQWFEGGTLHKATVAQWKSATYQNKLATAADWLAATKWKGYLKSPDDFDKIKVKAQMLVNAVDEVVTVKQTDPLQVAEIAAAIVLMSNDLGPSVQQIKEGPTVAPTPTVEQEKVVVPKYTILGEDVYDAPIKTQVTLNVLVSGEMSEPALAVLLNQLYSSTRARRGFKYHDSPTNIYIYAFTSKERAESGMGQWIAMLQKSYDDVKPTISINQRQITQLGAKPEEGFGLSEERRREIWKELVLVEDRAREEAEEQYPLDPTQSLREGQVFQLSKETPLMPELEPAEPMTALQRMRRLAPQTTIKVLTVARKHQTPWYFVEAKSPSKDSLGSGWINSVALMGQSQVGPKEQLEKQAELESRLKDKYEDELAKKYGLTREQLEKISIEGIEKDWPFPR
jgi:hypothetical protein